MTNEHPRQHSQERGNQSPRREPIQDPNRPVGQVIRKADGTEIGFTRDGRLVGWNPNGENPPRQSRGQ